MLAALKIVFLNLEYFNNSQNFIIIGFIPCLSINSVFRKKDYYLSLTQIIIS